MKILIDIEDLKSVLSIDDEAARQIIEQTNRVRINENTLIEPRAPERRVHNCESAAQPR